MADRVVASWVEVTGCGTRYEDLTADGQVHVDYVPPLGEPWFEGDDDPDYNPICDCPCVPGAVLPGVRRLRLIAAVTQLVGACAEAAGTVYQPIAAAPPSQEDVEVNLLPCIQVSLSAALQLDVARAEDDAVAGRRRAGTGGGRADLRRAVRHGGAERPLSRSPRVTDGGVTRPVAPPVTPAADRVTAED